MRVSGSFQSHEFSVIFICVLCICIPSALLSERQRFCAGYKHRQDDVRDSTVLWYVFFNLDLVSLTLTASSLCVARARALLPLPHFPRVCVRGCISTYPSIGRAVVAHEHNLVNPLTEHLVSICLYRFLPKQQQLVCPM